VINATASHDVEILSEFDLLGLRIIEGTGKTDAIERILRNAVDDARRGYAENVVDGWSYVPNLISFS
jgi:hypothetical protein